MLIDTHAHLNFKDYTDMDDVIKRSIENGVGKIICVSSNVADSARSIEIAKQYKGTVFAAVGIHPQCTDPQNPDHLGLQRDKLERLISENLDVVVAIGECGLDYTETGEGERKRKESEQEKLFAYQINLAVKYNLPILIHCNKAQERLLEILNEDQIQVGEDENKILGFKIGNILRGVFHFYSGGKKRLKLFIPFQGFMFGVDGPTTYDEGLQQVVREIPIDRIVLETDCPYLAPSPHRGERNEPAYISLIAQEVARIKGVDLDEVSRQTTKNVEKIFSI
jgi:TatD DNase family protein